MFKSSLCRSCLYISMNLLTMMFFFSKKASLSDLLTCLKYISYISPCGDQCDVKIWPLIAIKDNLSIFATSLKFFYDKVLEFSSSKHTYITWWIYIFRDMFLKVFHECWFASYLLHFCRFTCLICPCSVRRPKAEYKRLQNCFKLRTPGG